MPKPGSTSASISLTPTKTEKEQPMQEPDKQATIPAEHGRTDCNDCGQSISAKAEICPHCGVRQHEPRKPVSKTALLLITFFFGGVGAHKFYLGKNGWGFLYLLFFWTGIPGLIALIEFIIYAFTGSRRLNEKYSANGSAVVIIIVFFVLIMVVGILAAIAIPAYSEYTSRAHIAEGMAASQQYRLDIESFVRNNQRLPHSIEDIDTTQPPSDRPYRISIDGNGAIVIEYTTGAAKGKAIVLSPLFDPVERQISSWTCQGTNLADRYLPKDCR
jgi:TM2 domain-containing membrane protein YozV/Tfp pilus assembly protein PilE